MIKKTLYILFLMIISLVVPNNDAVACCTKGNTQATTSESKTQQISCSDETVNESKNCCNFNHNENSQCPGDCNGSSCQCLSTPVFITPGTTLSAMIFTTYSPYSYVWDYHQHTSIFTFNAIWQPPQFS